MRGLALETYTEAASTHGKKVRVTRLRIETEGMTWKMRRVLSVSIKCKSLHCVTPAPAAAKETNQIWAGYFAGGSALPLLKYLVYSYSGQSKHFLNTRTFSSLTLPTFPKAPAQLCSLLEWFGQPEIKQGTVRQGLKFSFLGETKSGEGHGNIYRWFVRDVTVAMLAVKNKSISLLWELNSIFM